jgi:hypothetical protein
MVCVFYDEACISDERTPSFGFFLPYWTYMGQDKNKLQTEFVAEQPVTWAEFRYKNSVMLFGTL